MGVEPSPALEVSRSRRSRQQAVAVLAARPLTDRLAVHTRPETHDMTSHVTSYTNRGTCESISQPRVSS